MNFFAVLKNFSKSSKSSPVPAGAHYSFNVARTRFEESQRAIQSSVTRAKHYGIIWGHRRGIANASKIYEQESANYSVDDFAPYAETDLDAYTARMEALAASFDSLVAAFGALESATVDQYDDLYIEAGACFNIYCQTFKMFASDYKLATTLAIAAAAEAAAQAAKDAAKAWLKATIINPDAEVKTTEAETKADLFKKKAKAAAIKADELVAEAQKFTEEIDTLLDS